MKEYSKIVEIFLPLYINGTLTNYIISDWGDIINTCTNKHLTAVCGEHGYYRVCLTVNNESRDYSLHRLVAQTFIPNPENKPTVNHRIPGKQGKSMNYAWNLEWATHLEQTHHAISTGAKKSFKGENNIHAKITEHTANEICKLLSESFSVKYISKKLNVSTTIINNILYKVSWVEISSKYNIDKDRVENDKHNKQSLDKNIIFSILKYYDEGLSPKDIQKQLCVPVPRYIISNIVNKQNYYKREKMEYYKLLK